MRDGGGGARRLHRPLQQPGIARQRRRPVAESGLGGPPVSRGTMVTAPIAAGAAGLHEAEGPGSNIVHLRPHTAPLAVRR